MAIKDKDNAIGITGLTELRKALKEMGPDVDKEFRVRMTGIMKEVKGRAQDNAPVGHGEPAPVRLRTSIRTTVTRTGAAVYSTAPHAVTQDKGGRVGYGAVLERSKVSAYMTRAVRDSAPDVERQLNDILDSVEREWGKGK